jgi:hypothetical protein
MFRNGIDHGDSITTGNFPARESCFSCSQSYSPKEKRLNGCLNPAARGAQAVVEFQLGLDGVSPHRGGARLPDGMCIY